MQQNVLMILFVEEILIHRKTDTSFISNITEIHVKRQIPQLSVFCVFSATCLLLVVIHSEFKSALHKILIINNQSMTLARH